MKNRNLVIGLTLVVALAMLNPALATRTLEDHPRQDSPQRVGLVSTAVECLTVKAGGPNKASATVRLEWEGQVEEAFLVLTAAGSQGGHSIYVNGWLVGRAPIRPGGRLCQIGSPAAMPILTDVIRVPSEAIAKGENVITLTNDADLNDGWTAANLSLEIHGVLTGPPAASLEAPFQAPRPVVAGATAVISSSVALTSSYELVQGRTITQVIYYQIPVSYTSAVSTPLVIGVHGYGDTGLGLFNLLAAEANNRGWLLAAPGMHGKYSINTGKYALAYVGAQHDVIDTIEYMTTHYNVDKSRLYIAGVSMGGQIATVMDAKYPDVFAATVEWSGITDLADWYGVLRSLSWTSLLNQIRRETDPACTPDANYSTGCGTPVQQPFEYQRRSAMTMPPNSRLLPLKIWHALQDQLVPIHHSRDLRDAINSWNPPIPVTLVEVDYPDECGTYYHCYNPPMNQVYDSLAGFTLSAQSLLSLTIRTDESKPYYWLNLAQTGGDHWSQVSAVYDPISATVRATISDTRPLTVAFNLGAVPITGTAGISQPGMGLPATTYLIKGSGSDLLSMYTSGYLTVPLASTGEFSLTISAIDASLSANPSSVVGGQASFSTITAAFEDRLNNPVPDGVAVEFSASAGLFPNGASIYTATTSGGQVTALLTLSPGFTSPLITASIGNVSATTSVEVIALIYLPAVMRN